MSVDDEPCRTAYSSETPWLPPAPPVGFVVDKNRRLDLGWLAEVLGSDSAELLIRSHLQPQDPRDKNYMSNWSMFWRALGFANQAEVAALLTGWIASAAAELEAAEPDSEQVRLARRFRGDVEQAHNRLLHTAGEPLSWAGVVWSKYPQGPRRVIEALVSAIALHRAGEVNDAELHGVLKCLGLEPGNKGEQIDEDNLQIVFDALANGDPLNYS